MGFQICILTTPQVILLHAKNGEQLPGNKTLYIRGTPCHLTDWQDAYGVAHCQGSRNAGAVLSRAKVQTQPLFPFPGGLENVFEILAQEYSNSSQHRAELAHFQPLPGRYIMGW